MPKSKWNLFEMPTVLFLVFSARGEWRKIDAQLKYFVGRGAIH